MTHLDRNAVEGTRPDVRGRLDTLLRRRESVTKVRVLPGVHVCRCQDGNRPSRAFQSVGVRSLDL